MSIIRFASTLALLLTACVAASAQAAKGNYQFTLGDKYVKYVEFDAQALSDGGATGSLFLSDDALITYQDVDGEGTKPETYRGYYISASFDEMTVIENRAVMGGVVRDSSIQAMIGQRVLLTVEDNGDNTRVPDKLTWGIYRQTKRDWTPSDAEWKEDPGVGLRWWATDAEVKDDRGYEMPRDETVSHKSFPFSAYLFIDTDDGAGDIFVRP
ncbi:MAG TPA: hypothetical protein VF611_16090 [Pyrinomonadaceae bacterium]|jgi:hypothetical protein